jgi:hypothetical protein
MAKKRKKGRKLAKRYGNRAHPVSGRRQKRAHARKGHSYAEGSASVPVRVHGTLYISPEPLAAEIVEMIEESPRLTDAIVEEVVAEVLPEVEEALADEHDYWPSSHHGG